MSRELFEEIKKQWIGNVDRISAQVHHRTELLKSKRILQHWLDKEYTPLKAHVDERVAAAAASAANLEARRTEYVARLAQIEHDLAQNADVIQGIKDDAASQDKAASARKLVDIILQNLT